MEKKNRRRTYVIGGGVVVVAIVAYLMHGCQDGSVAPLLRKANP